MLITRQAKVKTLDELTSIPARCFFAIHQGRSGEKGAALTQPVYDPKDAVRMLDDAPEQAPRAWIRCRSILRGEVGWGREEAGELFAPNCQWGNLRAKA